MKFKIGKSKYSWLIVLIICLLSISVIIFLGTKSNDEIQNIVQKQFNERQLLLSKQISSGMSEFLNEKTIVIEVMASHLSDPSQDAISTEFETVYSKTSGVYVFEFIDKDGVVITGYPRENTPVGYDLYKFERPEDNETKLILIDTFEWVRDKKQTNITSSVHLLEGGLGAFIWTPVYKGNEFKGAILAIIKTSDISNKFLKNYKYPWDIYLIDDRGTVLYDSSLLKVGTTYQYAANGTDPHLQQMLQDQLKGKEGTCYYFENNMSEKKLIAYSPIIWRNENWSIAVISPESEINALIGSVFVKQSIFMGAAVVFIILGSFSIIILLTRWNKSLEIEVTKKTRELNESNKLLKDANEKLKEIDKLKSDFLSMVSHELRTPLTAMKTSSEFLLEEKSGLIVKQELIQVLLRNIDRLTRLVNNLLDISMIESGKLKYNRETVGLQDIIGMAVDTMKNQYEVKGLNLTIDIPENLSKMNVDKDRMIQVILNLLNNALKFTHEGGNVKISAFEYENYIEIHVEDDGVGIPPDKIDKIFNIFYQIDNSSTRSYAGAGLGLAITKGIIEDHGGSISAISAPSRGSIFILKLPKLHISQPLQ